MGPLALGAVRTFEFAILEGLTAAAMLLWVARLWLDPRPQLLWPPICWAVLAFTAYAVARYFTADIEYVARQELLRVILYCSMFFLILNNLHGQESVKLISFTLIFLALAISGYALYQYLSGSDKVWTFIRPELYLRRGSGTYICPNHLGGLLEMLLPLALAYTLTGRLKPVTRVFVGYAALGMMVGLAASVSRGAWIAAVTALLLLVAVLLFRRQHRIPALILLVLIGTAGAVFMKRSSVTQDRLNDLVTHRGEVNDGLRFSLWKPAAAMWLDHPWWGVGPGHFDARFRAYRPEGVQLSPERAHNDYLNTLADWGIAGFALVASAWLLLGYGVFKTWRSRRLAPADLGGKSTSDKYAFVLGASLGLSALLVHSALDFNMHIPANAILAVTLMALLTSHLRFATESFWWRPGLLMKIPVSLALAAPFLYVIPQAWRQSQEFVWLERARQAPVFSRVQTQLLKKANSVEPMNPSTTFAIAEIYRQQSQEGGQFYIGQTNVNYRTLAEEAMQWFKRGMALNRYDSRNWSGYGWCLDWLDRQSESPPYFAEAERLDPNNYFNVNYIALHYVQSGNLAAAKSWFERSTRLEWNANELARIYLPIIQTRLLEGATNDLSARLRGLPK